MIKIETVDKPYMRYVAKVIPLAFDESMSYYECICSFYKYLTDEIMPALNNNAEAVAELQNLYIALKDYVDNYFDNLDLQTEVDNKLDEMYENGQLQSLIEQFIDLEVTFTFDTIEDMKEATNLVDKTNVKTLGFYSLNDGGSAYYRVRPVTTDDTVDEITIIALTDETLVAELIIKDVMNFKQFGAKGDGETDDTASIQLCLSNCHNILVNGGVYMIDPVTSVKPISNSKIELVNATLKAIPNDATNYAIVMFDNVHDIELSGGILEGEREDHTGATGEWGHGIHIKGGSYNIYVHDLTIKNTWGDGLYINNAKNINSQNLYIDNARRNGISVINVDTYHSLNDYVYDTNGTAPQSAMDIEPNNTTDKIKNIIIDNFTGINSVGDGLDIILSELDGTSDDVSITINNLKIDTTGSHGIYGGYPSTCKGKIVINHPNILNVQQNGIQMACRYSSTSIKLEILYPFIKNFNLVSNNYCGIQLGAGDSNWGNAYIKCPYVETNNVGIVNGRGIVIGGYASYHPVNVILDTPLNKQLPIRTSYGDNIKIIDTLDVLTSNDLTDNANIINESDVNVTYTNEGFTANVTVVPRPYSSTGTDYTFRKIGSGNLTVRLAAGEYCHALSDDVRPRITLTKVGESITLRKISSTEWIPVNIVGNPTITS